MISAEVLRSDLSHYGLIKVHGEDAESFLQNQLTNEVHNVTETSHQITAWCSPKGRIIVTFRLFKRDNAYYLSLSQDLLEHVIKKLSMYVMMSKVTIEDVTQSLAHVGVSGDSAGDVLAEVLGEILPTEDNQAAFINNLNILKIAGTVPRFEIFGEAEDVKNLREKIDSASDSYWDYLNILAGTPSISHANSEAWIPQMVNFIAVDGVDFKKGCYPGQEIVARLNYLGKTKRRMYHILIETNEHPEIGAQISSADSDDAGKILNAVVNPEGKVEALAVLKIAEDNKPLALADNHEASITLLDLPYIVSND